VKSKSNQSVCSNDNKMLIFCYAHNWRLNMVSFDRRSIILYRHEDGLPSPTLTCYDSLITGWFPAAARYLHNHQGNLFATSFSRLAQIYARTLETETNVCICIRQWNKSIVEVNEWIFKN
jgi:hypothetical protein